MNTIIKPISFQYSQISMNDLTKSVIQKPLLCPFYRFQ